MSKLEVICTPYTRERALVGSRSDLQLVIRRRTITDRSLASALNVALGRGRRFLLVPGPKDW